ncbi:MAG: hypothetical protein ACOC6D_07700 [Atribacterota bacterium]
MPPYNAYKCSQCGFELPTGWGGHMYVENDNGERIACPHPREYEKAVRVLGIDEEVLGIGSPFSESFKKRSLTEDEKALLEAKTGFNSYCLCLDCLSQFELDLGDDENSPWSYSYGPSTKKDERICPHCNSKKVKTVFELIDHPCPKCGEGVIEKLERGYS